MDDRALDNGLSRKSLLKAGAAGVALALGTRPVVQAALGELSSPAAEAAEAGAGSAPVLHSAPVLGSSRGSDPSYLRLETYLPHLDSTFRIQRPGLPALPVRLVAATPLPVHVEGEAPIASDGSSFSLLFRARGKAELLAGNHVFVHRELGSFPLGVSPVGRAVAGQGFQVIVSRYSI